MNIEDHCKETLEIFGIEWYKVHAWLDEFSGRFWPWMGHRVIRHHKEGIEEIREMWGEEAAAAAEMHVITDEGKVMTRKQIEKRYSWETVRDSYDNYPGSAYPWEKIKGD